MTAIVAWCACWYLFSNSLAFTLYFVLFKLTIGLQLYYCTSRIGGNLTDRAANRS